MARVDLTDELLRKAYDERRRADWPPTYEETMEHPTYSRLVRMHAAHDAVIARVVRPIVQPPEPPPLPRTSAKPLRVPRQQPILDHKRAAAGEREDD